jgi:hypothetical protein
MTTVALVFLALSPWLLWALYVMVMGIYRAHLDKRLTPTTRVLAAPWVALGFAIDILVNFTFASVVFLEPPGELLVTSRLQRHSKAAFGWRRDLSVWVCSHLLDVFDPTGNHC